MRNTHFASDAHTRTSKSNLRGSVRGCMSTFLPCLHVTTDSPAEFMLCPPEWTPTATHTHTHICLFLALGLHTHPQGAHQLPSWERERGTSVGGLELVVLSETDVINTCWVDRETDPWESQLASQTSLLCLFLSVSWWSSFTQSNTFKRHERHFQGDQRYFNHYFLTEDS